MDQVKIGKFIAKKRKENHLTQAQLAERLGVTNKTVSRWENGNYMPDLSLLKLLGEVLGVTINDLLSGNEIEASKTVQSCETNLWRTIEYSNEKIDKTRKSFALLLQILGLSLLIGVVIFCSRSDHWCFLYAIVGILFIAFGFVRVLPMKKLALKISCFFASFLLLFGVSIVIDSFIVRLKKVPPIYHIVHQKGDIVQYQGFLDHVFLIHANTSHQYYFLDQQKQYTIDTVPVSPFQQDKNGLKALLEYKNLYVGNHVNDGNLIAHLPLAEYGYLFEIDSRDCGLIVDYRTPSWYIASSYLKQSLIYNSVSMFLLIDNLAYVRYQFQDQFFETTREVIENEFPEYNQIYKQGDLSLDAFSAYVESSLQQEGFVETIFSNVFMG